MGRYSTISVEVEVGDVLDNLSDQDLLDELKSRSVTIKSEAKDRDHLLDVYHHLNVGEYVDATIALHALLFPKFKSPEDCLAKFKAYRAATQEPTP